MAEVLRSRIGVTTHLLPDGPLTEETRLTALHAAVEECLGQHEFELVLDLSSVPLANGAALELLLDTQERLARSGGSIALANPNAVLRDVFRFTGLDARIAVHERDGAGEVGALGPGPGRSDRRIGEILLERGLVDEETIEKALALQRETGRRMAELLVEKGWLAERDLLLALSEQLGVPFVTLRAGVYDPAAVTMIDREVALRLRVAPLFQVHGVVFLATPDPQSVPAMDAVQDLTGCKVRPVLACAEQIRAATEEAHSGKEDLAEYVGDLESDLELVESQHEDEALIDQLAAGSPVINLVNGVIQRAVRDGASDVHIEPSRTRTRIRLRVDGLLYTIMTPPIEVHSALVSRLKVMASLDIAERRHPQDGRIQVVTSGRTVDLRFSSLPGIFGEKIVLRVLDKNRSILEIGRLGMSDHTRRAFEQLLTRSYGLILVTGPTGSGKTTTLYAAINHLTSDEKNIVTIEDPVEYQIDAINQNQVREQIGLTFAKVLKHVLRQDPDIIMVGEIRERETAEIAVQAALTGHLVLSTLHTNDSVGAITRMLDMGVEPFLLSSALAGVVAQRLVRTVCPECETSYVAAPEVLEPYGVRPEGTLRLKKGRGCSTCYDSGFRGRMPIHELLDCDTELQRLVVSNPSRDQLEEFLGRRGVRTLLRDGVARALEGRTTLEEVLRVVNA